MIRQHTTHTPDTIAAALSFVPSDDRDTWIEMGMAVKSELGDAGFDVWNDWSQSAENYKERDAKSVWKSIKEGGRITIGTLLYEAKQRGFKLNGHGKEYTAEEWERLRKERDERQRIEAERKAKEEQAASVLAEQIYSAADAALPNHPYLVRKGVSPCHGLRVGNWYQVGADGKRFREKSNCLLVPMRDAEGKLWNLQAIFSERDPELERDKDYLLGGRKQGTYFSIGRPEGAVAIGEGFATMASIRAATGLAVCVAFDKGNLLPVGKALREKLPDVRLIFAADNDIKEGKPNYGVEKSSAAAAEVGGYIAIPELDGKKADFNDLSQVKGHDAVKAAIEGAQPVAAPKEQGASVQAKQEQQAGKVIYQRLSDIEAKPIHWLWPGRIARGKPTMIAGNPGLGKSQTTASLAAVVTSGGQWPVDRVRCEKGSVLFLSAEDDPADTIRPRLEAAGADVSKVHILKAVLDSYDSAGQEVHRAFNLKADIRRLEEALAEIGDVALVVIDPISAYLGNGDSHNNAEVRALLAPLSDMASRQNVAVVLVSHLNKGGAGGEALMRVTGSLAFVAAARAAFIVAKDPDDENRRLFIPAKNNIAKDVGGLAFRIEGYNLDSGIETSRVMWETAPVNGVTADSILSLQDPEEKGARDEAKAFLLELLKPGSMPSKDVFVNARGAGVAEKTLRRAAQDLGVVKSKVGMDGGWMWKLPEQPKMANVAEDALPNEEGNFGASGHLRDGEEVI
jgi:putative DNA primase/helicase